MAQGQRSQAPQSIFPVARTSTVDLIAMALRNAIYSGALEVGTPIREVEMAKQLGVSRSPLREAMQRLVQERLLRAVPGRGLWVSTIDGDEVLDLYFARAAVESEAIRILINRQNPQDLEQVEQAYASLEEATLSQDAKAISDADINFHQTLVNCAGSQRLSGYMAGLAIETRIALFSLPEGFAVPSEVSPTYRELLDCLSRGDGQGAVSALKRQFDEATARMRGTHQVDTVETPPDEHPPPVQPIHE